MTTPFGNEQQAYRVGGSTALDADPDGTPVVNIADFEASLPDGEDCLICIHGAKIGQRFTLSTEDLVLGRGSSSDVSIKHTTISRRHATIERKENRRVVVDMGSTNGVYVNGKQVQREVLRSGDHLRLGGVLLKYLAGDNIENLYHRELHRLSMEDGLTGISNRSFLHAALEREFHRARRHKLQVALMIFDVDGFKSVNDTMGHLAGDAVLQSLVELLRPRMRKEDCFARYGGDEFCVLMPDTPMDGARVYAETVRSMIRANKFHFEGRPIPITVSVGLAEIADGMTSPEQILRVADRRLLEAKALGRNRVVDGSDDEPSRSDLY